LFEVSAIALGLEMTGHLDFGFKLAGLPRFGHFSLEQSKYSCMSSSADNRQINFFADLVCRERTLGGALWLHESSIMATRMSSKSIWFEFYLYYM
jgi:hypothetical protein